MATQADLVRDGCGRLAGYRSALEYLITEPSSRQDGIAPLPADTPFPGNSAAFSALMVIWEKVPRLEAALRLAVTGHPGLRRGGSAGNFLEALAAIPGLAAGLDEDGEAAAARILDWLANLARAVPAIDEVKHWRPLPGRACPYCRSGWLKADMDTRPVRIVCFYEYCPGDGNGLRAAATMGTDDSGVPGLAWNDGRWEPAPDLEG